MLGQPPSHSPPNPRMNKAHSAPPQACLGFQGQGQLSGLPGSPGASTEAVGSQVLLEEQSDLSLFSAKLVGLDSLVLWPWQGLRDMSCWQRT